MASVAIIFVILLVNSVKGTQTSVTKLYQTTEVNTLLEDSTEAVFALQIRQIRTTSEATPAASAGNNLNVVGAVASNSLNVQTENSQAISTIYSIDNKEATDKKYEDEVEGSYKLLLPFDGNVKEDMKRNPSVDYQNSHSEINVMPLVLDNCVDSNYKDNQNDFVGNERDLENTDFEISSQSNSKFNSVLTDNVNKRNADTSNHSLAMKSWLEKYKNLKLKNDERLQQKPKSIIIRKMSSTTIMPPPTIQIIPITREVFKESLDYVNSTFNLSVTENSMKGSYTEDWYETKDKTKIRFGKPPQSETYLIPTLKLEEGFYPFSFISEFFSLIHPFDFPVGVIKDIVSRKFSFPYSFLQSIKVESAFLISTITFACMAMVIPAYLIVLGFLSLISKSRNEDEMETGALFPEEEDAHCNDRMLTIAIFFVLLISCILISGMAISNEQARLASDSSRNVISCACADISSWLSAAARELHHSLVPPIDLVVQAYREDLRNVGKLLGDPIQHAIASESGIDLVLDSLADIVAESEELSTKISSLRDVCIRAGALASATSDRIKDLVRQLENMKKFCNKKDTPLCDTINASTMEMKIKFDLILQEQQLLELRSLGVDSLRRAISAAKTEFRALPSVISNQTSQARKDILRDIEFRRTAVHSSAKILSNIVRHLTEGLRIVATQLETALVRFQRYEFWRWTVMLACIVTFCFIISLIICGTICGCGKAKMHAKRTLQVSTVWLCVTSLILWTMISAIFLIAGHAEVYICHALWDKPQYQTLSKLLDRPSPLLENNEGIFDALFRDLENVTVDVSIKDILRDCEKDRPAFLVFQLDKVLDVNKETSYFEWEELQADLRRLASSINVGLLKTISVNFNKLFNKILMVSDVNLAKYRMDYNTPVVGKDLPSLVDQLENIAAQVTDLTTSGKLETLATRTQRLYTTNIKPLEQLRADVVFKLTELELQLMPFRRKLNISMSHIHTAQFYIDNQGDVIAHKKVSIYISRLISHAAGWRTHVLMSVGKNAARCRPLFSVYSAARALVCTRYVTSLHGWWVCGILLGLCWCTLLAPLCVKLWRSYDTKIRAQDSMSLTNLGSGQQGTPTTALCDSNSNWNIPGPPAPPRSDSW